MILEIPPPTKELWMKTPENAVVSVTNDVVVNTAELRQVSRGYEEEGGYYIKLYYKGISDVVRFDFGRTNECAEVRNETYHAIGAAMRAQLKI